MQRLGFLDERRLLYGPWKAFERDVARLLIVNGFDDVRVVGGAGDRGADVLGVKSGKLWVWQCKHTTTSTPPKAAVAEVVAAARYYEADRMVVATSRPPGQGLLEEKARFERQGLKIELAPPGVLLKRMKGSPEYAPSRRGLREYQENASSRFREALLDTGRAQLVLATGLGKTVVMAEVVADLYRDSLIKENRALVLAHTRELVDQLHKAFWYQLPSWVPTQQFSEGECPVHWDGITFATIQSVISRLDELPSFGLILVDEAHHVGADTFRRAINVLAPPMLGGVTATPWRGDAFDIDEILGQPLVKIGIGEGLQQGFLSEVDYRLLADNLDWNFVQEASTHKYSITQLNRKLIIPTRDEQAARLIKQAFESEGRRAAILFSPTIAHAKSMAAMMRRYGVRTEPIYGDLPPRERDKLMTRFRAGQLDVLTSVDLFNEGVDVPDVDLIVFMRTTHSRRIFVQQLGRGLRVSPGKKNVIVLDFVTDIRRIAEVIELDKAARGGPLERLGLGSRIVQFNDASAGSFLQEWMLDQASLFLRESDSTLELPEFEFPAPIPSGSVQ
jgi:superfamily II DNA or RNA helicase